MGGASLETFSGEAQLKKPSCNNQCTAVHYVHFVKYDDAVSFYDAVSDTI